MLSAQYKVYINPVDFIAKLSSNFYMQGETLFKNKVLKMLKTLPNTWVLKTQELSRRGTPDILMCVSGKFVALELKANPKSKVSALQVFNIDKINKSGGLGAVASPEDFPEVFAKIKNLAEKGA